MCVFPANVGEAAVFDEVKENKLLAMKREDLSHVGPWAGGEGDGKVVFAFGWRHEAQARVVLGVAIGTFEDAVFQLPVSRDRVKGKTYGREKILRWIRRGAEGAGGVVTAPAAGAIGAGAAGGGDDSAGVDETSACPADGGVDGAGGAGGVDDAGGDGGGARGAGFCAAAG